MNRRELLGSALVLGAAALAGPMAFADTLPAADAREDMRILKGALGLHPGLLRYNTQKQIDERLETIAKKYESAPDQASRFLLLSRFTASVRCGHTHCNPYNQSDAVVASVFDRRTRVPFAFTWIDGAMVILPSPHTDPRLPAGSEILRLNGQNPRSLRRKLLPYIRTDGHNRDKQIALLEMRNNETLETFDIFQGLVAPQEGATHSVKAKLPDGRVLNLELPALSLDERRAQSAAAKTDTLDEPFWTWEVRGDVAILSMPSWVMYKTKWDWKAWLESRLDTLPGLKGLVIDLRDNEGGNDCGDTILARLAPRDLTFAGYEQRVRFRQTPTDLDKYLDTWDSSFRKMGENARDTGDGFFVLPNETASTDFIAARGPRISLPVAALVGPVCSSATFSFARRARESGLVRLFGTQTGGNLRGINGGAYFFVRLPGSGLEFDVPLIGYFPQTEQPDRGVNPDVEVRRTADDIANGYDRCLEEAIAWCRR